MILVVPMYGKSLSRENFNLPIRYNDINPKIVTQSAINNSRFKNPQWYAKSTFDKNFNAKANSKNPKTTNAV